MSVGETEDPKISRMTIRVTCDEQTLEQIKKQLNKLINVIKVINLESEKSVFRELILVKIKVDDKNRASVIEIINLFRGKVVDVAPKSLMVELTGSKDKILAFLDNVKEYGILELVRTGFTGLERGNHQLLKKKDCMNC